MTAVPLIDEITALHANICFAMADPRRIMIIYTLAKAPCTVNELAVEIGASQPATSRHLKTLKDSGLVRSARIGANVEYSLSDQRLVEALDILRDILRDLLAHNASLIKE